MRRNRTVLETSLSPRQSNLIRLICSGMTIEKAATAAKISRSTAFRWLADPAFVVVLNRAQGETFDKAIGEFKANSLEAERVIVALMKNRNANVRRLAANSVTDTNFKIREIDSIEARIARLEKIAKKNADQGGH